MVAGGTAEISAHSRNGRRGRYRAERNAHGALQNWRPRLGLRIHQSEGRLLRRICSGQCATCRASPKRLDLLHTGSSAVTGLTALQGIDDHLRVRRGTTILVFGATGAVGTLAVQFAKRHGARVIGTAHGRAAMALLKKLRVDDVVDLNRKDGADQLRALAPDGIDAALALAGGKALEQLLDQMRTGGRIAFPNGVEPAPRKRSKIRIRSYDAIASPKHFARLNRAVEEARLQVPIAAVYSLAQAAKAHERIKRGHVLGRIVLRIRR